MSHKSADWEACGDGMIFPSACSISPETNQKVIWCFALMMVAEESPVFIVVTNDGPIWRVILCFEGNSAGNLRGWCCTVDAKTSSFPHSHFFSWGPWKNEETWFFCMFYVENQSIDHSIWKVHWIRLLMFEPSLEKKPGKQNHWSLMLVFPRLFFQLNPAILRVPDQPAAAVKVPVAETQAR